MNHELLWHDPRTSGSHFYRVINEHLLSKDIVAFRTVVAYVSWGGLSLVAEPLEMFLGRGKSLQTVFGISNEVTTADALLYSAYLQRRFPHYKEAYAYRWQFDNSQFHPKCYQFEYPDRVVSIVTSSNLTMGGLAYNHELGMTASCPTSSRSSKKASNWWDSVVSGGEPITPEVIRELKRRDDLGSECRQRKSTGRDKGARLQLKLKRAHKPFFSHVLRDPSTRLRHEMLAEADTLSERPKALYLQILGETGGGHQIQLPVATLGSFFSVGKGEVKHVTFRFPGVDDVNVDLTHFGNNTHRIRLLPLKGVPRPGIVRFRRTGDEGTYLCDVVSQDRYRQVLREKCSEQTREDSRLWGFGEA